MSKRRPPPHMPIPDGVADHRGRQACRVCSLPVEHKTHEGWQPDEETRAAELRRTGERE